MLTHLDGPDDLDPGAPAGELLRDHLRHAGGELDEDAPSAALGQHGEVRAPSFAQWADRVGRHANEGPNPPAALLHGRQRRCPGPSEVEALGSVGGLVVFAVLAIAIVLVGSVTIFGAHLDIGVPYFVLAIVLSIAEIFSLGLLVAALAPSQTAASAAAGVLFFVLLFLSGLWVQPAQVGGPLQAVMYYSPSGAAARALLDSVFNQATPLETILTMVGYTVAFTVAAIHFFRWE
jgi:hypothetical protein